MDATGTVNKPHGRGRDERVDADGRFIVAPARHRSWTSLLITTSLAVATAAIAIRQLNPELLLRVPRVGFVLYFLIGGVPIPSFFEQTAFDDDKEWLRPNDVVVSAGAKSGTTWLMETVNVIRQGGRLANTSDILLDTPWAEYRRFPGETKAQRHAYFRAVADRFPFAVYKSHYAPPRLTVRDDVRYVVSFRNPFNSLSSFLAMASQSMPGHRKWWGGFPPITEDDAASMERAVLDDKGDGKSGFFEDLVIDHFRGFWPHRHKKNVLWLHYDDRLKDRAGDVDKIARFLGVPLTPEEKNRALDLTSFEAMKARDRRYSFCGVFDEPRSYGLVPSYVDCMLRSFVVKGASRRGKDEMPAGMQARMLQMCHEKLGKPICDWLENGGPLPDVELPPA